MVLRLLHVLHGQQTLVPAGSVDVKAKTYMSLCSGGWLCCMADLLDELGWQRPHASMGQQMVAGLEASACVVSSMERTGY